MRHYFFGFRKLLGKHYGTNYWKQCEKSTLKIRYLIDINWSSLKTGTLVILELHDRFKNYEKKNDEHILISLNYKISPIICSPKICDPEAHNFTEDWTQF
mgnify:CR=1 FL=1